MKRFFAFLLLTSVTFTLAIPIFSQKIARSADRTTARKSDSGVEISAISDGNGVLIRWSTTAERNVLGYYVLRAGKGDPELLVSGLVPGGYLRSRLTEAFSGDYIYFDPDGRTSDSYVVQSLEVGGRQRSVGTADVVAVPDLQRFAGQSSADFATRSRIPGSVDLSKNNYPGGLAKEIEGSSFSPNLPSQRVVAGQPGVKIFVKDKGLYRVTRTQLENAGFNVNSPSENWQLFTDGNEQSIIVGPGDAYIEFLGEGMDTLESAQRAYFLVAGATGGKRIGTSVIRPLSAPVVSNGFRQTFERRERATYLSGILNGNEGNFFSSQVIANGSTLSYTLPLSEVDFSSPWSKIRFSLQGLTVNPHDVQITVNGQPMPSTIAFQGQTNGVGEFDIATSNLIAGNNTIQFRSLAGPNDFVLIDKISVEYSRTYAASQNRLAFFSPMYKTARLTGFSSANVRVFDVTETDRPTMVDNVHAVANGPSFDLTIPSNRSRALFAVEDSGIMSPLSVVPNYPSTLSSPSNSAGMIIVTHRDWLAEAQTWADYRTSTGVNSVVVDVADVYDEFSYGVQSAAGMTDFFQFASQNWQTPPQYILLMGDSTYDPKNYGNFAYNTFVPTELVDTLYEETGSDEALCDFNNDGLAEIAVGRIPARNGTELTQMLAKTIQFESTIATALDRGALFVADQPIGYDFDGVNNRIAQQLPPTMPKVFISRNIPDPNPRTLLLAELNIGRFLVNYSGHGSTLFWAESGFYHRNDIASMNNQDNYSLFTLLTCLNGYFVSPYFDTFAEVAVKSPNRAAVAAWASSGRTTPDVQEVMATRFYNQISVGTITRMGDLVKDAKQSLVGGRDVRLSWTLLGDPALKVR